MHGQFRAGGGQHETQSKTTHEQSRAGDGQHYGTDYSKHPKLVTYIKELAGCISSRDIGVLTPPKSGKHIF